MGSDNIMRCAPEFQELLRSVVFDTLDPLETGLIPIETIEHLSSARPTLKQRPNAWSEEDNQQLLELCHGSATADGQVPELDLVDLFVNQMPNDFEEFIRLTLDFGQVRTLAVHLYTDALPLYHSTATTTSLFVESCTAAHCQNTAARTTTRTAAHC